MDMDFDFIFHSGLARQSADLEWLGNVDEYSAAR
jgi:hypothetical protein